MSYAINQKIDQARRLLTHLNFDRERTNERSALVLLALLGLKPETPWREATSSMLRTVEIMAWIRDYYDRDYMPNTRETIRRQTLHQFVEASLVEQNSDNPDRPVNSPRWCYRVHARALEIAQVWGGSVPERLIREYLVDVPGLRDQYAAARQLHRIPVMLPSGDALTLSPGGQNVLIRTIVEDFCAYYTPGGHVLYIGDADAKWAVFEEPMLASLGVTVNQHGKMPDLVIYLPERNWLVLLEAASSHGPVDAKRHRELATLLPARQQAWCTSPAFPHVWRCEST